MKKQSKADRYREHSGMERYERGPVHERQKRHKKHNPYHAQSKSARRREHSGMEKYERGPVLAHHHRSSKGDEDMHTELYHRGGSYYGSGHNDPSNLPQHVIHHFYPHTYSNLTGDYPDTLREIDRDMLDAFHKAARYPSDSMY